MIHPSITLFKTSFFKNALFRVIHTSINLFNQNFPKFAIFSVKISFLTNENKIFGISVVFYTRKSFIKSLLYFQFLFIERAVNTLVVLILNQFSNLKELNEHFVDRTFKSFSFSVSVLDKKIVNMKELFPLYSIVNQHKLSHAEWTAITQKFKNNNTQNFATYSNQS